MKILAIDTSTTLASVAYSDGNVILTKSINNEITHSEKLLTIIDEILSENNVKVKDIDLFTSTIGPRFFYRNTYRNFNNKSICSGKYS